MTLSDFDRRFLSGYGVPVISILAALMVGAALGSVIVNLWGK